MMKNIALLTTFLFLACTQRLSTSDNPEKLLELGNSNYSVQIPNVPYVRRIEDGNVAATSLPDQLLSVNDWRIEIYEKLSPSPQPETSNQKAETPACSTLGVSEPKTLALGDGGGAVWGRVDFYDGTDYLYNTEPAPICKPPRPQSNLIPAAYALCSEKAGKSVLICISQIKDNEPLARKIFETFRWLPQ